MEAFIWSVDFCHHQSTLWIKIILYFLNTERLGLDKESKKRQYEKITNCNIYTQMKKLGVDNLFGIFLPPPTKTLKKNRTKIYLPYTIYIYHIV